MTDQIKDTAPVSLEAEMRRSYLDYAMSVIVGRALPDVRDGLKPVHRRVFFAMHEMGVEWNRAHVKSSRVSGDVLGKYHPHGETAIYDTMVRMAQNFSLRYMLIDGQGNFGSVDGDPAAASRYTAVRISRIGHELLADIEKETVDFGPNYDGKEQEPLLLPARVPNLLINGASGIAVGMATNIPPHNIKEVIKACITLLKVPETPIEDLMKIILAPDFPTKGLIYGMDGVREAYLTGRGRVIMRGRTHIEDMEKGGRQALIIDELPYQVNKRVLVERIAELLQTKQLEGVSEGGLRDESDKSGMRIVLELKRGEVPEILLNNLYKHTQLQDTFGVNMVALVHGRPQLLNLKQVLEHFVSHRREVVTRRCLFDLRNARARAHILEGFAVALSNVDEMIALIKASATPVDAKQALMDRAWPSATVVKMLDRTDMAPARPEGLAPQFGLSKDGYHLSETQAQAILELRLQRLTAMEQDKILKEYQEVIDLITELLDILAKPARITAMIIAELQEVDKQFGDDRRSEIVPHTSDITMESLIAKEDMVVTMSHGGYIKGLPLTEYRSQRRGGRGKQAAPVKEDDFVDRIFMANSHDHLLGFSNKGRLYWLRVYQVPQGTRQSRGKPVVNLFPLQDKEKITAMLPVSSFDEKHFIFMATAQGTVKKVPLTEFSRPRPSGIIALDLQDGDSLIGVALTDGACDVMLLSSGGKAVRFAEDNVRPMGRAARGVRGMRLGKDESVIAMLVAWGNEKNVAVLTATEKGYGKRTSVQEYTRHARGTKGMIAIETSKRNGALIGAALVQPEDHVMLISSTGVLIRTPVKSIREAGRATQGVRLIQLDAGSTLAGLEKVVENDDETDKEPS